MLFRRIYLVPTLACLIIHVPLCEGTERSTDSERELQKALPPGATGRKGRRGGPSNPHTNPYPFHSVVNLDVRRTQSHFELLNMKPDFDKQAIAIRNLTNPLVSTSWGGVQPTEESIGEQRTPHVQTSSAYLLYHKGIFLKPKKSWILSVQAKLLPSTNRNYDIILGPRAHCNCQLRFEAGNTVGVVFTGRTGSGVHVSNVPLPYDAKDDYHVLTLMYHKKRNRLQLYQDEKLVRSWPNIGNFAAEFGYLGSWFRGQHAGHIALKKISYVESTEADGLGPATMPSIESHLQQQEMVLQH